MALVGGEYDVLAEIPLPWEQAARIIVDDVILLPGVVATKTLVSVPNLEPEGEDRDRFSAWT